jgi:hypothetical protein
MALGKFIEAPGAWMLRADHRGDADRPSRRRDWREGATALMHLLPVSCTCLEGTV